MCMHCTHRPQFQLEVEEVPGLAKQLETWRRDMHQPLVVEVSTRHLN